MINITNELSDAHKKISQTGNCAQDHWEIHGEATRHVSPESTRCTQEIPRSHR
jgi:hypothetical protein